MIWSQLPSGAHKYQGYFKVIVNEQRLGQIASIDKVYADIKTKYVYHLEEDWVQIAGYGLLERMKDALADAESKSVKVSQVVQTFPLWDSSHVLGRLHRTKQSTKYYSMTSFGK